MTSAVTDDLHHFLALALVPFYQPIQMVTIPYAKFAMNPTIAKFLVAASAGSDAFRSFVVFPTDPEIVAPFQAEWSPQTGNILELGEPKGTSLDLVAYDMFVVVSPSGIARPWVRRMALAFAEWPLELGETE
jgi:hypothetical protein